MISRPAKARSSASFLLLLALVLMACRSTQSTLPARAEKHDQSITDFYRLWFSAVERGDTEGLLDLVDEEFVLKWPFTPPLSDRDLLRQRLISLNQQARQEIEWKLEDGVVHGDWAWARVSERTTHRPLAGGAARTFSGSHLSILRRRRGAWRLYRDQGSLDALPRASIESTGRQQHR